MHGRGLGWRDHDDLRYAKHQPIGCGCGIDEDRVGHRICQSSVRLWPLRRSNNAEHEHCQEVRGCSCVVHGARPPHHRKPADQRPHRVDVAFRDMAIQPAHRRACRVQDFGCGADDGDDVRPRDPRLRALPPRGDHGCARGEAPWSKGDVRRGAAPPLPVRGQRRRAQGSGLRSSSPRDSEGPRCSVGEHGHYRRFLLAPRPAHQGGEVVGEPPPRLSGPRDDAATAAHCRQRRQADHRGPHPPHPHQPSPHLPPPRAARHLRRDRPRPQVGDSRIPPADQVWLDPLRRPQGGWHGVARRAAGRARLPRWAGVG
mmetsp:Transcript_66891/g.139407  ORF Transcript_66891/g.139407 Transcript_66891/m.139407 type:complete len:314 (-) Transcript_66891:169-1110(-)